MKYLKELGGMALIIAISCLGLQEVNAQNYRTGLGARLGSPWGFTVKHFVSNNSAFEGIVGSRGRGAEFVALYEYHVYPAKRKEFAVYFGGGGHVGAYDHHRHYYWNDHHNHKDDVVHDHRTFAAGVDGIIGISWTFENAPVNLGLDYKPAIMLTHDAGFLYGDAAISVRYVFK